MNTQIPPAIVGTSVMATGHVRTGIVGTAVAETTDADEQASAPLAPLSPAPPALSPARAALASARQDRADAEVEYQEASRTLLVAEEFIVERDRICARITEIERINAGMVERWVAAGESDAPEAHAEVELDILCRDVTEAERLAAAASVAMPALVARAEAAQQSVDAATTAIREAIVAIIAEEMAVELDTIREEERRTARRRATVHAAIRVLSLMGARYHAPAARAAAQRLHLSVPAALVPTDALIRDQMLEFQHWVEDLFNDEGATR
jgi:hypothetical protein